MLDTLHRLGLQVLREWRAAEREPGAFAPLAERALRQHIAALVAPAHAWADALARAPALPKQNLRTTFGEPPVTVFLRAGVQVDVYFWLSPLTAIHDHGFSGAFGVLHGVSLHTTFRFDSEQPEDAAVRQGRLERREAELLHAGEVRAIAGVQRLIHQVAHLSHPSVSVCVRTTRDVGAPRQRVYLAPGLAIVSDLHLPGRARRQLDLAGMLARVDGGLATALPWIDAADDLLAFWLLERLFRRGDAGLLFQALARCRPRPWFDALLPALFQASAEARTADEPADETARLRRLLDGTGAVGEALLGQWRTREDERRGRVGVS